MIAGQIKSGDNFFLPSGQTSGRWFRRVDTILHDAGIMLPQVLPDAACGFATTVHQNCIVVQELRTGGFFFIDCDVTVEKFRGDDE